MESLFASYASSDEDDREPEQSPAKRQNAPFSSSSKVSSLLSSLPQPKSSSSIFSSLPQPKQQTLIDKIPNSIAHEDKDSTNLPKSTSLFSSMPRPKSQPPTQSQSKSVSKPSRVVQFRPPIIAPASNSADFDDDEDEEIEKKKQREAEYSAQPPSVMSFLSSIPAPRNSSTLGAMPSSGSGRRSIIETASLDENQLNYNQKSANSDENPLNYNQNSVDYVNHDSDYPNNASGSVEYSVAETAASVGDHVDYASYQTYDQNVSGGGDASNYQGHYENYNADHGQQSFVNNWDDRSASISAGVTDNAMRVFGKRGRNEIPSDINIKEVRQDELMKNRPREDQVKTTGIAFGPSYLPVSTKGKPSKLHKRKHQISSLFFDMKRNETELSERRSKGFQTKAQTQAKYGW